MFSVGDKVEVVADIDYGDFACDELIGAVGTVVAVDFNDTTYVDGIHNVKYCISFEYDYETTWWLDDNKPNCRWILENEIRLVTPIESFEDELLKLLGGSTE